MRAAWLTLALFSGCLAREAEAPLLRFTLRESEQAIERRMGPTAHTVRQRSYSVLEFGQDDSEHNDLGYEWTFYFERPSGELLSVTHNLQPASNVDAFFPSGQTRTHRLEQPGSPPINAISRLLPGDRILIAVGMSQRQGGCAQVILMRRSALSRFYPWIAEDLK